MTPLTLGIDLGTSSVKVVAVDDRGGVAASGTAAYPVLRPQPSHAEQDPGVWWEAVVAAVRRVVDALPEPSAIVAIGLSGQMHGTVLLGADGEPLRPAVIWPDQRSSREVDAMLSTHGEAWFLSHTGGLPATGFQIATLRWIQTHEPDIWAQTRHVLLPKDTIRWRLTGVLSTDPSDACGTGLLDIRARSWSADVCAAADVQQSQLPQLHPSRAVVGALQPTAADALGLPHGLPVVNGAADTACSVLCAAATSPDTLLVTLSTGGQMVWPQREATVDAAGRAYTFCSALDPASGAAGWYVLGGPLAAGLALNWVLERVVGARSAEDRDAILAAAETVGPGAGGLTFVPTLIGERTPRRDPLARGMFHGLSPEHGQPELVRAVLEGVVLALLDGYSTFEALGAQPRQLVVSGGGANVSAWRQMLADAFALPTCWLAAGDQSAFGAAVLAGDGAGLYDAAAAVKAWAACRETLAPNPDVTRIYRERLHGYRRVRDSAV
ncbi:MAG: xylulokinase [Chloroflexi bacterium]|nr:xylulokinase [Chloroflexota bacterium]